MYINVVLIPLLNSFHGCVLSTLATDALVLKPQAISTHNADTTFLVLDQFHDKILHLWWKTLKNKLNVEKMPQLFKGKAKLNTRSPPPFTSVNKYIHYKVWDEITYPFQNFNGCTVEVWEWINNSIPYFTGHVIAYPF